MGYKIRSLCLLFYVLIGLISLFSCGSSINDAQDFIPNEPPVIQNKSFELLSPIAPTNELRGDFLFEIRVKAYDPEGEQLTYGFTSDFGTFGAKEIVDEVCIVQFLTNENVKAETPVMVTVNVSDPIKAFAEDSIIVGTGKKEAVITAILTAGSDTITFSEDATIEFAADCEGIYQVFYNNAIAPENVEIDDTQKIYRYEKIGGILIPASIVVAGPSSSTAAAEKLPGVGTYKVWVVFNDYINPDTAKLCTITVE